MDPAEPLQVQQLFHKVAPPSFFRELCLQHGYQYRDGTYTASVVVWLMIWQRLRAQRSLAAAVQHLAWGGAEELRAEGKTVSAATGGYCQARQRLPNQLAREVNDRVAETLRVEMQEGWSGVQRPVFLIDGSTVQLTAEEELRKAFPAGRNQHGENHWPVMRIVVLHDVFSGLALRPQWGAMYGAEAVSEQALAERALERLPADAVVLSDCNFGIFAFAYAVQQGKRALILRLTAARAQKILGTEPVCGTDQKVTWRPSRWERKAHPELPDEAAVEGRLLVCANPSRPDERLYLFTSLDLPAEEMVGMYKLRWNIETDLRSLKQTVGLHQIHSKSLDMVEKELLLAVAAYNLIRAVMCLAARRIHRPPRQLSFSFVQTVVEAALPSLQNASTAAEYQRQLERMLGYAAQATLPRRSRTRSYPRAVWGRGGHFPTHRRGEPTS